MTAPFRLAALLRLRTAERDAAAGELARARGRVRDDDAVVARTRQSLDGLAPAAADVPELRAIAAARLSATNMIGELHRQADADRVGLAEASAAFTTAAVRLRTLDRLATRTAAAQREAELGREQAALDELAQHRRERLA